DGNVKRVLARYHAIGGCPGRSAVARALWERAERHLPRTRVAAYTQGLMDLGATLCTRAAPACERCPLEAGCEASRAGRQADFPGKKPRAGKPLRRTCMVLACLDGALYLEKRPPAGIWGGLWSLPELGNRDELPAWCAERLSASPASCDEWPALRHSFSHFDLDIRPLFVRLDRASAMVADDGGRWMPLAGATDLGLAAPVRRLIDSLRERVAAS
ncbi:MAG: NUDIX domain-containing protein, partial [Woeseiaceae bacterium]